MADNTQQTGINTNTFSKGMMKDYNESFVGDGMYTHARNAVNNSHDGQVGILGNEPSNISCVTLPYTMIGCVHLFDDQWVIFSTDNTNSEIGIFDESACTYEAIKTKEGYPINFNCLGFKTTNLIIGVTRFRFDCQYIIYFDDGLNPTRSINIGDVPVLKTCTYVGTCVTCVPALTNGVATLDCEAIRLASLITHPCLTIKQGQVAGTLPNGSYQACLAYLVNGVKVTDYIGLTNVQGLFTHENTSSSLEIKVENIDTDFEEFDLVILANINSQTVAKKIGTYSTSQGVIYVDRWSTEYITVSISDIVLRTEPIEKSDAMFAVNEYLLRVGTYSKFKFNYQPLANKISTKWVAVQYPADYYVRGNNNTGYMRDEQYAFFIRFIYNTGEYSESYHIPGRPSLPSDTATVMGADAFESTQPNAPVMQYWQVYNTASVTSIIQSSPSYLNGGRIIATGNMGYWESTEKYPANRPDIWNTDVPNSPLNLCGKNIRHHKMPDETVHPALSTFNNNGSNIVLLGVQFDNISFPVDNDGNPIESIVGYEILRGSREGNKSILAKGLINNMREYDISGNTIKGLFQNYPYNDLRPDQYLTTVEQTGENGNQNKPLMTAYKKDYFSFHSPDVTFSNPYLNPNELKLYSLYNGVVDGYFENPYKHPRDSQITDLANSLVTALAGFMATAQSVSAVAGGFDVTLGADTDVVKNNIGSSNVLAEGLLGAVGTVFAIPAAASNILVASSLYGIPAINGLNAILNLLGINFLNPVSNLFPGLVSIKSQLYRMFKQIVPKRQFARQFNSHGFYNKSYINTLSGNIRRKILKSTYVSGNIQQFNQSYQINNVNRSKYVAVQLNADISDPNVLNSQYVEKSRYILSQIPDPNEKQIYSYYAGMKLAIPSQYGQLESIKQYPIATYDELGKCKPYITPGKPVFKTGVLFGGDIYINRFTEKNTMFFFTDWLMGQPDLIEFDYTRYINVPYPKYWINSEYDGPSVSQTVPSNYRSLDDEQFQFIPISIKRGAFYLFNSGVRDFFVESEVNVAYRDWEEDIAKRHYDPDRFTDLSLMFRSDIIQSGNYYKYDYSLSISKLVNSHITWGNTLPRNYDPIVSETCYVYRPFRVIYSLPQKDESKRDTWRVFLANNYKDFPSNITSIKQINKTGALFMMKYQSPLMFTGVEELQLTGTNTKVTIGDGGLFNQAFQAAVNVDESYEYGSNQGKYCAINTTYGLFWVSQNQGKVFQYGGGINDITNGGMKWWFAKYLPSELLKVYPEYPYGDNPVAGVGVQMLYDNTNEIIYLTKKDWKPKFTDPSTLQLVNGQFYLPNSNTPIPFTNTQYFEPANFTISYDPKAKTWISFHDWHPTFNIPGRSHFMTVARGVGATKDSIWKHNITCTSYCKFYGVDYPFEIEFISSTGQQVASMRNLEYILEVYNYHNDCRDKFHVLDQNFDQAIVYNSEQISGVLQLNLKQKNNPLSLLTYPQINTNYIGIQYSKEENKYRFNQFWDITNNRGEYAPVSIPMFNVEPNGYRFSVNPAYVNYNKPPLERKKFRHYVNRVFLRKTVSGNNKMLFKISNEKLLQSYR